MVGHLRVRVWLGVSNLRLLLRRPRPLRMLLMVRRLRLLRLVRRCLGPEAERGKGEGELARPMREELTWLGSGAG